MAPSRTQAAVSDGRHRHHHPDPTRPELPRHVPNPVTSPRLAAGFTLLFLFLPIPVIIVFSFNNPRASSTTPGRASRSRTGCARSSTRHSPGPCGSVSKWPRSPPRSPWCWNAGGHRPCPPTVPGSKGRGHVHDPAMTSPKVVAGRLAADTVPQHGMGDRVPHHHHRPRRLRDQLHRDDGAGPHPRLRLDPRGRVAGSRASPTRTFFKVTLPLIVPGIVAAAMLSFALSRRLHHHLLRQRLYGDLPRCTSTPPPPGRCAAADQRAGHRDPVDQPGAAGSRNALSAQARRRVPDRREHRSVPGVDSPLAVYLAVGCIIGLEPGHPAAGRDRAGQCRRAGVAGRRHQPGVGRCRGHHQGDRRRLHRLHHRPQIRDDALREGWRFPQPLRHRARRPAKQLFTRWGCGRCSSGRFIALLRIWRSVGPARCACAAIPYFLAANASGAICWAGGTTAVV